MARAQTDALLPEATTPEARRTVMTPEHVPLFVTLADRTERAGAVVIDLLLIQLLLALLGGILAAWKGMIFLGSIADAAYTLGSFVLLNFYFIIFELRWNGQTPGKRIMKIRVIDAQGGSLTGGAIVARNLLRMLEIFLPLAILGGASADPVQAWKQFFLWIWLGAMLALPFIDRDRMRAGDLVAGTWVITAPRLRLLPDITDKDWHADATHHFSRDHLLVYGTYELHRLDQILRDGKSDVVYEAALRIAAKIRYPEEIDHPVAFLEDFYKALRHHLEAELLLGRRKTDQFDRPSR